MRRVFVIFLIFLFPLNVLALSMSVSSMGPAKATPFAIAAVIAAEAPVAGTDTYFADSGNVQSICDIDPDEPPAGTDFHDCVNREARARLAVLPEESIASPVPPRRGLPPFPPIKPPPRA